MYDAGFVANFVHGNVPDGSQTFYLGQPTRSDILGIIAAYVGANGATQTILSSTPSNGNVELNGANVFFDIGGVIKWGVDPSGHLVPKVAGLNLGGGSGYPINTLTVSNIVATGTFTGNGTITATNGFSSLSTNNVILRTPNGGSWILRCGDSGTLSTVTNTSNL
jgi:hypothetical protein